MASVAPSIRQRFFSANGAPLAGGKLYSYAAGTSTPQATYTDNTGATPNANPVVMDANGEANIWLADLSYKFVLKDSSDVTQWTVDNVSNWAEAPTAAYRWGGTSGGTANALTLTPTQTFTSYQIGVTFAFISSNTNTGAATVNINSLGAKSIVRQSAVALGNGEIATGNVYLITYDGTNFVLNSSIADGSVTLAALSSQVIDPRFTLNYAIAATVASNAMTIALKNAAGTDPAVAGPSKFAFRNATLATGTPIVRIVSAALSTVISSGSTGGTKNAVAEYIHVYAIDNASAVELAWSGSRIWDESQLHSTTSEGGAGAADSKTTLYSTTARTNVPVRYIGSIRSTQTTAGTWVTAPSEISLFHRNSNSIPRSEVHVTTTTSTQTGTDDTMVRYFSVINTNIGSAISVSNTTTKGSVFTINEDGVYAITYVDSMISSGDTTGISKNSTALTTSILNSANDAFRLLAFSIDTGFNTTGSVVTNLVAGDIIRPHTNTASTPTGESVVNCFRIVKVA